MAKVLSFVATDSPISGVTTNPINLELVNFGADFVEKSNSAKKEILITNIKAPIGAPENFRYSMGSAEDVYRGSEIDPSYRSQTRRGVSVLVQHTITLKETDSADVTYERLVPIKIHTVLVYPAIESLTADLAEKLFRRHAAGLYETGEHDSGRVGQLLRGSLLPPDVK